jgi:hypothetical protein
VGGGAFGKPLRGQETERLLEGIVHVPGAVVVEIKCHDGAVWVIDYGQQSPYKAFVGRWVVVSGVPCEPPMQHALGVTGHFGVSTMRLVDATPDAWLMEVGAAQHLAGRFEDATGARESALSFVTEKGESFLVANNPAGATVGCTVKVLTYRVQPSPYISRSPQQYLWVIGPCSYADLEELHGRLNAGLPRGVYQDNESGQFRCRPGSAEPSATADGGRDPGS